MDARGLMDAVDADRERNVKSLCEMLRIKAVGPESGGEGEGERGKYLMSLVKGMGFKDVTMLESPDPSVPSGKRPNIIIREKGSTDRNLWVVTHMDVVPEGDLAAWKHPPFEPHIEDGRIYARGAEDNGQELIASLFALHALVKSRITPEMNIGIVFVSDEEHGNTHGIDFLLAKNLFKKGDLVVVPDHGQADGATMCVVEKGIAWINVEVIGRQVHASTPHKGVNAFEVSARYMLKAVDLLRSRFSLSDPLFDPPTSTFEPTKCDSNGPNVNTVPGKQQFAFDFRVLPDYKLDDIMAELQSLAKEFERDFKVKINLGYLQKSESAPKTSVESDIVKRLAVAIKTVRGADARAIGIGGGTCANPFRARGIEAVVWSTIRETAHDANEYSVIEDLISDTKVYALLFAGSSVKGR